jgi:rubrerythrin
MKSWSVETLPWEQIKPDAVNDNTLKVIKAAALVEFNADAYAEYLCKIFHDDEAFISAAKQWAKEEVQHGKALGLWAEKIDPSWSFEDAMETFREGYVPEHFLGPVDASIRGSRSGEMIARCMVETATSSYYSAIGDNVDEPVLKQICRHIAADEFKHYKLFYDTLNRYLVKENLGKLKRMRIALSRISESEDDELSFAYYAANENKSNEYNRKIYSTAYLSRAYSFYKFKHTERAVAMIFKACGLKPQTLIYKLTTKLAWRKINAEAKKYKKFAKSPESKIS